MIVHRHPTHAAAALASAVRHALDSTGITLDPPLERRLLVELTDELEVRHWRYDTDHDRTHQQRRDRAASPGYGSPG